MAEKMNQSCAQSNQSTHQLGSHMDWTWGWNEETSWFEVISVRGEPIVYIGNPFAIYLKWAVAECGIFQKPEKHLQWCFRSYELINHRARVQNVCFKPQNKLAVCLGTECQSPIPTKRPFNLGNHRIQTSTDCVPKIALPMCRYSAIKFVSSIKITTHFW